MVQITKDNAYDAVAPDDFPAMLEVERYSHRNTAFDKIISATHDHFWDPLDKKYIDFDEPFDLENEAMVPDEQQPLLRLPYVAESLKDPKQKIAFINYMQLRGFSSILHGEQGALNLSASLCHVLKDQGAQEYAANQTREEAHRGPADDVRGGGEPLAVDRERAIEMPHDHRHVLEDQTVLDPPEADDFLADLIGALHVVVPDSPQMFGALHRRILDFFVASSPFTPRAEARRQ